MPVVINQPSIIQAAGNKPKIIEEYIGLVNSKNGSVSIARMQSPAGWVEPGQTPEFDEYTVLLKGKLRIETKSGIIDLHEKQAVLINKGEWVRYSSPEEGGAEYISVCLPAFSPGTVHRDE